MFVYSKEIEATNEWKLLGENDTIPAGLHVKIDMTTGEKWVKQIDPEEEDGQESGSNNESNNDNSHKGVSAVIQSDGAVQVDVKGSTGASSNGEAQKEGKPDYDFAMMHRTLSKLPPEEQQRMGGIPELPQGKTSWATLTAAEREMIEKRMEEIWKRRQEELRKIEEEFMLDLPKVLKDRIQRIQEYLLDPISNLSLLPTDASAQEDINSKVIVTDIVSVLEDLELQLTDVDMARDFHTLGGWPLLVSLLSDDAHISPNATIRNEGFPSRLVHKKQRVQAYAAWVIGTAIKNTGEFFPYAVEPVEIVKRDRSNDSDAPGSKMTTTAIDLLIKLFLNDYDDDNSWDIRFLQSKAIYGIGALLRGNRAAQTHVCATDGPAELGAKLKELVSPTSSRLTSANVKLIQRLLSLVGDIITDVHTMGDEKYQTTNEQLHTAIIQSFTSETWCDATLTLLSTDRFIPVPLVETLLTTINVAAPYCHDTWHSLDTGRIESAQNSLLKLKTEFAANPDDYDLEHHKDLLHLVETAIKSVEKKTK